MRRLVVAMVVVVVVLATAPPAGAGPREDYEATIGQPPARRDPPGGLGHTWSGESSAIAGTAALSRGELIVVDRPFDDTGADTVPGNGDVVGAALDAATLPLGGVGSAYRYGDFAYPSDPSYGRNAADLVEVRLAADEEAFYVTFQLQTLIDPARTVTGLAIDADRDASTGRPGWSGYEHLLQVTGTGADLDGNPVGSRADAAANAYEARVPRSALPGGTWRVAPAAGLWDGDGWSGIVDLGWVADEEIVAVPNCWQDRRQSRLLAAGTFPGLEVDTDRLRAESSDPAALLRGAMTRVYPPQLQLGEGIAGQPRYNQGAANVYRGSVQPYTLYVPQSYDPGRLNPLIVLLHCLTCNHTIFTWASWPGLRDLAESTGALVVTPLGYGEGGHYEGEAEVDVFEVMRDVRARYEIDPDGIYLTGMSMGALGTFRLGLLYPDLWARALPIAVYTNPFCVTPSQRNALGCAATTINYFNVLENARNVPFAIVNGVLDELTPVTGAREIADRFQELGYSYRYWEYPTQPHDPALHGLTAPTISPWLRDFRRVADPARVTFRLHRDMDRDSGPFGIVHDRAYWLRDIRMAEGAPALEVDAASGRGTVVRTDPYAASGSDPAGQWTARGLDPRLDRVDGANSLSLVARSVESLTVRPQDAGLVLHQPLVVDVDTDRPLSVRVEGRPEGLSVPAGRSRVVLEPTAPVPGTAEAGDSTGAHPATGSSPAAAAMAALAAVTCLFARRRARNP